MRHPRAPRGLRGLGLLAVVVALLGAGGLYFQLEKQVTLVVDGDARAVKTFSSSVGALLAGEGVELGEHDEVSPAPGAPLSDGDRVEVLIAKEITLLLNGRSRTLYVTGKTVEDVLEQVNVRASGRAFVRPSRAASIDDGDTIEFRPAVSVVVAVEGAEKDIITNAPDVGYLLDSMGVFLGRHDRVDPGVRSPLDNGMRITVTRVRIREVAEQRDIPFETEVRESDQLLKGVRRVDREGSHGVEELTFRVRLEDGEEVRRTLLSREVLRQPLSRIEVVGTRSPNVQTGVASWYHRSGMTAAHRTLPFGTQVKVTNLANGKSVTVVIDDRGPFVAGRIIDLSDGAYAQLAPLSSGTINVRIEW